MFKLGRKGAVACYGSPAIREHFGTPVLAGVDHRLDGEEHASLQRKASAGAAIMHNRRRTMENPAKPMATELTHNAEAHRLNMGLNGMPDIAKASTGLYQLNGFHQAFVSGIYQLFGAHTCFASNIHA